MSIFARLKKRLTGLLQRHYRWALNALPEDERKAHLDTVRGAAAEQVLERIRKAQGVDSLPETYCQYMLAQGLARNRRGSVTLAGSQKLGWMRRQGGFYEDYEPRTPSFGMEKLMTRNQLIMRLSDYNLRHPEDLFVFFSDLQCTFYFFRTQPQDDNPAVYSYEGGNCFYKLTDSFSEFLELATGESKNTGQWEASHQAAYLFDSAKDAFIPVQGPDFSRLPERLQTALAARSQLTASFYGCTEADLEVLRKAQGVECLPEVYCQVMLAMGGYGLGCILDGYANFGKAVQELKWYTDEFKEDELDYPPDLFLFMGHDQGTGCRFFRTAGCPDDPPVYGYWEDGAYHKLADSLTDYLVWELEHDPYVRDEASEQIYGTDYRYDATLAAFVLIEPLPEDLPLDELIKHIRHDVERMLSWSQQEPRGCTHADLDALMKAQGVAFLPETYRQVMLSVGRAGLDKLFYSRKSAYEDALKAKASFRAKSAEKGQPVPDDAFVFYTHDDHSFYFFQTQSRDDDPAVYLYDTHDGFLCFGEHLTTYWRETLDDNHYRRQQRGWYRYLNQYQYDPVQQELSPLPQPDENPSLDKVRKVIAGRWFWEKRQGCTEDDLEALQERQDVNCLPETYRQLMLEIGRHGIEFVLGQGADIAAMTGTDKASMFWTVYPPDAFVLVSQPAPYGNIFFIRTKGCEADPPVYVSRPGGLYVATDCLTRFMLQHLDENTRRQNYLEEQWFRRTLRYDADRDELLTVSGN